jgi:hypothetical protein
MRGWVLRAISSSTCVFRAMRRFSRLELADQLLAERAPPLPGALHLGQQVGHLLLRADPRHAPLLQLLGARPQRPARERLPLRELRHTPLL